MKKFIRFTVFILIASTIFLSLNNLLTRKTLYGWWNMTTKTNGFFNSERDTYDVIFTGSSHAYCSFNPLVIGEETGLSSYTLATQKQPLWATYYYIKEAVERQKPKLIVLDVFAFSLLDEYQDDGTNYTFTDDFPFGENKLKMVAESAPPEKRFDLLVKFTKYHSRWKELESQDFGFNRKELFDSLYGYCMLTTAAEGLTRTDTSSATAMKSSDKNEKWLREIIKYLQDLDIPLIIVKTPLMDTPEERGYFLRAEEIAKEYNVPFYYMNDQFDEIGLDIETDFYDRAHLNHKGADKFSRYFAKNYLGDITPKKELPEIFYKRLNKYKDEFGGDYNPFILEPMFVKYQRSI
ncbi:MAG: hypothetical protein Q4B31_00250 [Clostridia bacterium]|nr:hypothetical protein [Clostridia bacterium]